MKMYKDKLRWSVRGGMQDWAGGVTDFVSDGKKVYIVSF
jgi:hypothetical protein